MSVYQRLVRSPIFHAFMPRRSPMRWRSIFNGRLTTYRRARRARQPRGAGADRARRRSPARASAISARIRDRYFEVLLGAFKARAVIVGVNWRLAPPEIAYVLNDAGCEVLFVGKEYYESDRKNPRRLPEAQTR